MILPQRQQMKRGTPRSHLHLALVLFIYRLSSRIRECSQRTTSTSLQVPKQIHCFLFKTLYWNEINAHSIRSRISGCRCSFELARWSNYIVILFIYIYLFIRYWLLYFWIERVRSNKLSDEWRKLLEYFERNKYVYVKNVSSNLLSHLQLNFSFWFMQCMRLRYS